MIKIVAVLGNENSMSSLALLSKHSDVELYACQTMPEVIKYIKERKGNGFLPFWNSHAGEVTQSEVIDSLDNEEVKVVEMLPNQIKFACILKEGVSTINPDDEVISVHVAAHQCSSFIDGNTLNFIEGGSTTKAFNTFKEEGYKIFLGAKENMQNSNLKLFQEDVSNAYNFTSFALLQDPSARVNHSQSTILSLVEIPNPSESEGSIQHQFLDTLFEDQELNMDALAKPSFIRLKEDGRVHLIIEHHDLAGEDIISEDSDELEVSTKQVGSLNKPYGVLAKKMMGNTFGLDIQEYDFLKHIGTKSCLFFCPALNIYLHGYNADIVEDFIKIFIEKYFIKYSEGIPTNSEQKSFFDRNFSSFEEYSMRNFKFIDIATC